MGVAIYYYHFTLMNHIQNKHPAEYEKVVHPYSFRLIHFADINFLFSRNNLNDDRVAYYKRRLKFLYCSSIIWIYIYLGACFLFIVLFPTCFFKIVFSGLK